MDDLKRISSEVTANIFEITLGIASIGGAIREVAILSENVGLESVRLDQEVGRFKVQEQMPVT
jgi:hypothetical protein